MTKRKTPNSEKVEELTPDKQSSEKSPKNDGSTEVNEGLGNGSHSESTEISDEYSAGANEEEDVVEQSDNGASINTEPGLVDTERSITIDTIEATTEESDTAPSKRTTLLNIWRHHRVRIVAFSALGIAVTTAVIFQSTRTTLMTMTVAGTPVGRKVAVKPLEQELQKNVNQYKLSIRHDDGTIKSFALGEAGIQADIPATIEQTRKNQRNAPLLSRLSFWRKQSTGLALKIDEAIFTEFISSQVTIATKPGENATLKIDKGKTVITPEATGQGFGIPNARDSLVRGIGSLKLEPFKLESMELKPAILADNLDESKKKADSILGQSIKLTIGEKNIKASAADIGSWIELTPVEHDKTVDVTVNGGKVLDYLTAIARAYIIPVKAQIVSTEPDGSSVVLVQGQNGTDIKNKDAVATDITKKIIAGSEVSVTLPIVYTPFKTVSAQAYDKWLAVDVRSKRMYAYEKTKLAQTFLISAGAPDSPTVLGQYNIYTKLAKQDMRGQNTDGSRYSQPNVQWVNYFHKDYAIHGNYWRPTSYFGNINSSHGCVGIVNVDAKWVYDWAPVGTPVIVYD